MTETNINETQPTPQARLKALQERAGNGAAIKAKVVNEAGEAAHNPSVKQPITLELAPDVQANLGTRRIAALRPSQFPDAGASVQTLTSSTRPAGTVDVLLVNPPTPDGAIWIRSQHRVGRRSRENMIWPQVSLAQLAADDSAGSGAEPRRRGRKGYVHPPDRQSGARTEDNLDDDRISESRRDRCG